MMNTLELDRLFDTYRPQYKTLVVDAFLLNETGDAILLQKRAPNRRLFPGFWDAVGGHVDGEETLMQALHREVHEESNMKLTEIRWFREEDLEAIESSLTPSMRTGLLNAFAAL